MEHVKANKLLDRFVAKCRVGSHHNTQHHIELYDLQRSQHHNLAELKSFTKLKITEIN